MVNARLVISASLSIVQSMSPSTPTNTDGHGRRLAISLPRPLKAVAFWAAVLLPFFMLALVVGWAATPSHYLVLAGLLCANVLALVVGHDYGR